MTLHVEQIAARIQVCKEAEKIVAGQDTVFGFYAGQRHAYEKVFGEAYNWQFPEEWTLSETVAEAMDAYRPEYRASLLESAITSCSAWDYLRVDKETGTLAPAETEEKTS